MKKGSLIILLLSAAILCISCGLPAVDGYDNFLADLDIEMRIDMCMKQIDEENPSWYTRADLKTIQDDLNTLQIQDESIKEINQLFLDTSQELQRSVALLDENDTDGARISYQKAYDMRLQAKDLLHTLHEGGPPSV